MERQPNKEESKKIAEAFEGFKNIPSAPQDGSNPIGFIMGLIQLTKLARSANKIATPAMKSAWNEEMYRKRWRNFLTMPIFIGVCIFFLWLGINFKSGFYNFVYWYIWMGLASIFLLLGIYTWIHYLVIIIRGRK